MLNSGQARNYSVQELYKEMLSPVPEMGIRGTRRRKQLQARRTRFPHSNIANEAAKDLRDRLFLVTRNGAQEKIITLSDPEMDLVTERLRSCWSGSASNFRFRHTVFNLAGLDRKYYGMAVILPKTPVLF